MTRDLLVRRLRRGSYSKKKSHQVFHVYSTEMHCQFLSLEVSEPRNSFAQAVSSRSSLLDIKNTERGCISSRLYTPSSGGCGNCRCSSHDHVELRIQHVKDLPASLQLGQHHPDAKKQYIIGFSSTWQVNIDDNRTLKVLCSSKIAVFLSGCCKTSKLQVLWYPLPGACL